MTRFNDEAELSEWWEISGEPWFAVKDAATDIYILSCNEDGDVFWTAMPNEEDDEATGWLHDWKATYPLDLLEYVPDEDSPSERERRAAEKAWDDALNAVAWCIDHGSPDIGDALSYTAKNNPNRAQTSADVQNSDPILDTSYGHANTLATSGPHSRACGFREHEHGTGCHSNCPTCGGRVRVDAPRSDS